MSATGYLSSRFSCYIEQTAPIIGETLTTAPLPRGGKVYAFLVEILAKTNGGVPAHTVLMSKVSAAGVATAITAGGAFNFSTASAVSSTAIPSRQATGALIGPVVDFFGPGVASVAAGESLRITTAGAVGDLSQLRVHFLMATDPDVSPLTITSSA